MGPRRLPGGGASDRQKGEGQERRTTCTKVQRLDQSSLYGRTLQLLTNGPKGRPHTVTCFYSANVSCARIICQARNQGLNPTLGKTIVLSCVLFSFLRSGTTSSSVLMAPLLFMAKACR